MPDAEKWSPLDEWNAREAREEAARLEAGPPARQRRTRTSSGGPMRIVGRILLMGAVSLGIATYNESHGRSATSLNGECVILTGVAPHRAIEPIRCGWDHSGKVIAAVSSLATCPAGTDTTFVLKSDKNNKLCIDLDQ
jgi:hypothetical protein